MNQRFINGLVTWGGAGRSPKAPGTVGTLAALPVAVLLHATLGMASVAIGAVVLFFIGWWASNRYMAATGKAQDPQEIVVDEVVGMWLTLSCMPIMYLDPAPKTVVALYGAAFVAFRLFDIWKPWPVSWADRRVKGGLGVMLDDVLAAVLALLSLGVLGHLLAALGVVEVAMQHGV